MRIAFHLTRGVVASMSYGKLGVATRELRVQQWSRHLLQILAIRLDITGTPLSATQPTMVVANHVSWLDVYALNAVCPAQFVAKSEIAAWPIIGRFARQCGTLFIERARRRDILRVNHELADHMRLGARTAVFPEGTTSSGESVLPFRSPLLQAAVACQAQLQAIAISYARPDGSGCVEARFIGDTSFAQTLWLVLKQPAIHARLHFLPAVSCTGKSRKVLARDARNDIAGALTRHAPALSAGDAPLARPSTTPDPLAPTVSGHLESC